MELQFHTNNNRLEASLAGIFTFEDNRAFRQLIKIAETESLQQITLDVSGLEQVDSAALGMFMMLHKISVEKSISVSIKNPNGAVKRMFELSRFQDLFYIVD